MIFDSTCTTYIVCTWFYELNLIVIAQLIRFQDWHIRSKVKHLIAFENKLVRFSDPDRIISSFPPPFILVYTYTLRLLEISNLGLSAGIMTSLYIRFFRKYQIQYGNTNNNVDTIQRAHNVPIQLLMANENYYYNTRNWLIQKVASKRFPLTRSVVSKFKATAGIGRKNVRYWSIWRVSLIFELLSLITLST